MNNIGSWLGYSQAFPASILKERTTHCKVSVYYEMMSNGSLLFHSPVRKHAGSCAPPPNGMIRWVLISREPALVPDTQPLPRTSFSLEGISRLYPGHEFCSCTQGMMKKGGRGYSMSNLFKKSASSLLSAPFLSSALPIS